MYAIRAGILLLTALIAAPLHAQVGQTEGINESFKSQKLEVQEWVNRFEVEGREAFDLRREIVAALGLKPGQIVADVGAGTGLFEPLLAAAVGSTGKVYAIDIAPRFIDHIDANIKKAGLSQVQTILSTEKSIELPANSVDVVFASDTYHHFVHYQDMLASIRKALKPGGQLVIVDFDIESKAVNPNMIEHVGKKKGEFRQQITDAGFNFDKDLTLSKMRTNFMYRFVKARDQ